MSDQVKHLEGPFSGDTAHVISDMNILDNDET